MNLQEDIKMIATQLTDTMEIVTITTSHNPDPLQLQVFKKEIADTLKRGFTIKDALNAKNGTLTQKLYKIRKINDRL